MKRMIVCAILGLAVVLSCGDKGTGDDDGGNIAATYSSLLGSWCFTDVTRDIYLTTSSEQTAIDLLGTNPGTGSIRITGAYAATLRYLKPGFGVLITATSHPEGTGLYPNYSLEIDDFVIFTQATFAVNIDDGNTIQFNATRIDSLFTLDDSLYRLEVRGMEMKNNGGTASVTAVGTLAANRVTCPAGTETKVISVTTDDLDSLGITFNADNTYRFINYTEAESSAGRWSIDSGELTVIDTTAVPPDTQIWTVLQNGGITIAQRDSLHCQADAACDYSTEETLFKLDPGSVTGARSVYNYTLTPAAP